MTTTKLTDIKDTSFRYSWHPESAPPFISSKGNTQMIGCNDITYKLNSEYDVMFGSNKPLDEKCTNITGNLTYDPTTSGNSLWNNSTRRKIIVNNKRN